MQRRVLVCALFLVVAAALHYQSAATQVESEVPILPVRPANSEHHGSSQAEHVPHHSSSSSSHSKSRQHHVQRGSHSKSGSRMPRFAEMRRHSPVHKHRFQATNQAPSQTGTTGTQATSGTQPNLATVPDSWLVKNSCWKFAPRKTLGHLRDTRGDHFAWVNPKQPLLYVWGGCGDGHHEPSCAETVQILNLKSQEWKEEIVKFEVPTTYVPVSGAAYATTPATNSVYEFGGSRTEEKTGAKITNVLAVLYEAGGNWNWKPVSVSGTAPPALKDATLTAIGNRLVLFGGWNEQFSNKLYTIFVYGSDSNNVWQVPEVVGDGPSPRAGTAAVQVPDGIIYFGGVTPDNAPLGDMWFLNTTASPWQWNKLEPANAGAAPSPRGFATANAIAGNRIAIFGGYAMFASNNTQMYYSDVKVYSIGANAWQYVPPSVSTGMVPKGRRKHASVSLDGMILYTGGCTGSGCLNIFHPFVLDMNAVCAGTDPSLPGTCKNGVYDERDAFGSCQCQAGYTGKFCEEKMKCLNDCSGRGDCISGRCRCKLGFSGEACQTEVCPANCNGANGQCHQREKRCICNVGRWGLDCAERNCANNCFGRGICQPASKPGLQDNVCKCLDGFSGSDCGVWGNYTRVNQNDLLPPLQAAQAEPSTTPPVYHQDFQCPNHCSGHGICKKYTGAGGQVQARCECEPGFAGLDCSGQCPLGCTSPAHGTCEGIDPLTVKCNCREGYKGVGCSETYCARNCTNHGTCEPPRSGVGLVCKCDDPWVGPACNVDRTCNGRGSLVNDRCKCEKNWGGFNCEKEVTCGVGCVNGDCYAVPVESDQVATTAGECKCKLGWKGTYCDEKDCPAKCNHHGLCMPNGDCQCFSGYAGKSCERVLQCPNNCTNSHGTCVEVDTVSNRGVCKCEPEWSGEDCRDIGCPSGCNDNGKCIQGKCLCKDGYSGPTCGDACPKLCSGKGICVDGACICQPGRFGDDCAQAGACPGNTTKCSGNGVCFEADGRCFCSPGWAGADCSKKDECVDLNRCAPHGQCQNGRCYCDPGYEGAACERMSACTANCSSRGVCMNGQCYCNAGFDGPSCEKFTNDTTCPNNCNNNGVCQYGRCLCARGYQGKACELPTAEGKCLSSPKDTKPCSGRGLCRYAQCFCEPGFTGPFCNQPEVCKGGCVKGQGLCLLGECRCLPGFKGPDCSEDMVCEGTPLPCTGRGVCIQGKCACFPGYTGTACETSNLALAASACPKNCTNGGVCHMGRCFCVEGRDGPDCSVKIQDACPNACSKRGLCRFGQCFCKPGYIGKGCEVEVKCSQKCLQNGVCAYGRCFCVHGYEGQDCDIPIDLDQKVKLAELDILHAEELSKNAAKRLSLNTTKVNGSSAADRFCHGGCMGRGICHNNRCACQTGYYGANCEKIRQGVLLARCPNQCNKQGECVFGRCLCKPGWTGSACDKYYPQTCPDNCNDHGICHLGTCKCDPGFEGRSCQKKAKCDPECTQSGKGVCVTSGRCWCVAGWKGKNCQEQDTSVVAGGAPPPQGEQGVARFRELNEPVPADVNALMLSSTDGCASGCGKNGLCVKDQCYCKNGFTGADCSLKASGSDFRFKENPEQQPTSLLSDSAVSIGSPSAPVVVQPPQLIASVGEANRFTYVLVGGLCFVAGMLATVVVQTIWAKRAESQKLQKSHNLLKPLIGTLEDASQ